MTNLKITNWLFVILGVFTLAIGLCLGLSLAAHCAYVSVSSLDIFNSFFIMLMCVIVGGLILDEGIDRVEEEK